MSMSRWATNWIICRSRSASGVFSARSASAIVGLVIVVPPVGLVFANSTLPKPTVTPRKGRAIAGGARKPAPGYALRGFPSAIDLHHLQGHAPDFDRDIERTRVGRQRHGTCWGPMSWNNDQNSCAVYSFRKHRKIADDRPVSTRYRSVSPGRTCRSTISGSGPQTDTHF